MTETSVTADYTDSVNIILLFCYRLRCLQRPAARFFFFIPYPAKHFFFTHHIKSVSNVTIDRRLRPKEIFVREAVSSTYSYVIQGEDHQQTRTKKDSTFQTACAPNNTQAGDERRSSADRAIWVTRTRVRHPAVYDAFLRLHGFPSPFFIRRAEGVDGTSRSSHSSNGASSASAFAAPLLEWLLLSTHSARRMKSDDVAAATQVLVRAGGPSMSFNRKKKNSPVSNAATA